MIENAKEVDIAPVISKITARIKAIKLVGNNQCFLGQLLLALICSVAYSAYAKTKVQSLQS